MYIINNLVFSGGSVVKNLSANTVDAGDMGSIPRSGRSFEMDLNQWIKILLDLNGW